MGALELILQAFKLFLLELSFLLEKGNASLGFILRFEMFIGHLSHLLFFLSDKLLEALGLAVGLLYLLFVVLREVRFHLLQLVYLQVFGDQLLILDCRFLCLFLDSIFEILSLAFAFLLLLFQLVGEVLFVLF